MPREPKARKPHKDWDEFPVVWRPNHPLADSLGMVPRRLAGGHDRDAAPHVISDSLGADLEHHGYADGRKTDSKSVFRTWTKQAGLVEKGNDREKPNRPSDAQLAKKLRNDVGRALQMVKQGYKPSLQIDPSARDGWH